MPKKTSAAQALNKLFKASERPIYAVDAERQIVYCNPALEAWLELPAERIVGRLVEYRSEPATDSATNADASGPLSDLCPPPRAFAGETCAGTVSCLPRDGRLVHRRAEFIPLDFVMPRGDAALHQNKSRESVSMLVLVAASNLSADELTAQVTNEPSADELHRTIRRFRRAQAGRYGLASVLGLSSAMRKVRSQIVAAAGSGANALIRGWPGTGRASIGRAIHYHAVGGEATVKLLPLDGQTLSDETLRRALDAASGPATDVSRRPTLLIENVEYVPAAQQTYLADVIRRNAIAARVVATTRLAPRAEEDAEEGFANDGNVEAASAREIGIDATLHDFLSTITIDVPRLAERLEDLPLLAQFFLEAANRGNAKQLGAVRPDALDLLALHTWPGELDELRATIAAAHEAANTHTITPADLPPAIHHAAKAAAMKRRPRERIVLNDLLERIEKEAIVRALAQAGGNKSEAAESLGLTRPRLYRRMEILGLLPPASEPMPRFKEAPLPDFREVEPEETA